MIKKLSFEQLEQRHLAAAILINGLLSEPDTSVPLTDQLFFSVKPGDEITFVAETNDPDLEVHYNPNFFFVDGGTVIVSPTVSSFGSNSQLLTVLDNPPDTIGSIGIVFPEPQELHLFIITPPDFTDFYNEDSPGDVNEDGFVVPGDALHEINFFVLVGPTPIEEMTGTIKLDANNDAVVDVKDVVLVIGLVIEEAKNV
jgi:hypothetical protein